MKSFKTPTLALASAAALTSAGFALPAHAVLTYNIFENGGNVVVQASGKLDLPQSAGISSCPSGSDPGGPPYSGAIFSVLGVVCTGPTAPHLVYLADGPASFNGSVYTTPASSISGLATYLLGKGSIIAGLSQFGIDSSYISGDPISSSARFNNTTLTGLGFTTTSGEIGEWTLQPANTSDPYTAYDKIKVVLGAPPASPSAAPGPLPLLGVGSAFGFSRRLRRRAARRPFLQLRA